MPDLKKKFSRTDWKDCCGKGCKKCEIAQTYIGVYGKSKGLREAQRGPRADAAGEEPQAQGPQEEGRQEVLSRVAPGQSSRP